MIDIKMIHHAADEYEDEYEEVLGRRILDDRHDRQENRDHEHHPGHECRHSVGPLHVRLGPPHDDEREHSEAVKRPNQKGGELDELDDVPHQHAEQRQHTLQRDSRRRCHPLHVHPAEERRHVAFASCHVAEPRYAELHAEAAAESG